MLGETVKVNDARKRTIQHWHDSYSFTCLPIPKTVQPPSLPHKTRDFTTYKSVIIHFIINEYSTDAIDPVTNNKVILASERFENTKTPGLDGIPNRYLKIAIKHCARPFTEMYK